MLRALLVVVAAMVLFLLVVNFSVVETALSCSGAISEQGASRPGKAVVTIRSYRPWVTLWSENKGYIWIDLPEQSGSCHVYLRDDSQLVRISDRAARLEGMYSTSSRTLHLQTPDWSFDAVCGSAASVGDSGSLPSLGSPADL